MDWINFPFEVDSDWFRENAKIKTYNINGLLGTKLRALHQRSKRRDLFDLNYTRLHKDLDIESIIKCFHRYMEFSVGKHHLKKSSYSTLKPRKKTQHLYEIWKRY